MTDNDILFRVAKDDINFVNQIMEGYEYLGVMSTFNKETGVQIIRTTADLRADVLKILTTMPCRMEILSKD